MTAERLLLVVLTTLVLVLAVLAFRPRVNMNAQTDAEPSPAQSEIPQKRSLPPGVITAVPLTVAADCSGSREGQSWWLSVNSAGQAQLWRSLDESVTLEISQEQFDGFRKALERERFFELNAAYGDSVPDSSSISVTVTAGSVTHTVTLLYTNNLPEAEQEEADRAWRVLKIVQGWVDGASQ